MENANYQILARHDHIAWCYEMNVDYIIQHEAIEQLSPLSAYVKEADQETFAKGPLQHLLHWIGL